MIVFQPIGYKDYKRHLELNFKCIPIELIKDETFKIYLSDEEAHRVAKSEFVDNPNSNYIAFVMQYCIEDDYIDYLKEINKISNDNWSEGRTLLIPTNDSDRINSFIVHKSFVVGFYYNKQNKDTDEPMDIQEVRKMQILHHYTQWDPEEFIGMCAPRDEYYYEINQIWNKINQNTSTEELAIIIKEVTEEAFGKNYMKKETDILEIAIKIDLNVKWKAV